MGEGIDPEMLGDWTVVLPNNSKPMSAFQDGKASVKVVS